MKHILSAAAVAVAAVAASQGTAQEASEVQIGGGGVFEVWEGYDPCQQGGPVPAIVADWCAYMLAKEELWLREAADTNDLPKVEFSKGTAFLLLRGVLERNEEASFQKVIAAAAILALDTDSFLDTQVHEGGILLDAAKSDRDPGRLH